MKRMRWMCIGAAVLCMARISSADVTGQTPDAIAFPGETAILEMTISGDDPLNALHGAFTYPSSLFHGPIVTAGPGAPGFIAKSGEATSGTVVFSLVNPDGISQLNQNEPVLRFHLKPRADIKKSHTAPFTFAFSRAARIYGVLPEEVYEISAMAPGGGPPVELVRFTDFTVTIVYIPSASRTWRGYK